MELIGNATKKLIKAWQGSRQREQEDALRNSLRKIFTKQEQRHITYYSLKDLRIILNVDSSAWLYLINLKKEQLLKNLNQSLQPNAAIVEIILRLDRNETKTQAKSKR